MKRRDFTGIVPSQYTGEEIEAESSINLKNKDETMLFFDEVKKGY